MRRNPPRYAPDVLAARAAPGPPAREVVLRVGLELTDRVTGFAGTVVECEAGVVVLEARDDGGRRAFPYGPDRFLHDGQPVRVRKGTGTPRSATVTSASGAVVARDAAAKIARASRLWVEGRHDADLLEKVWGAELRDLAIVVQPLHGADDLVGAVRSFRPGPERRLGVLLDHLVPGSKEDRIARDVRTAVASAGCADAVLVAGHPFVDVWAGVRPGVLGIPAWPDVPQGQPWKEGVAAALGVDDPRTVWQRALRGVRSLVDLETPLIGAVEQLLDFLTDP